MAAENTAVNVDTEYETDFDFSDETEEDVSGFDFSDEAAEDVSDFDFSEDESVEDTNFDFSENDEGTDEEPSSLFGETQDSDTFTFDDTEDTGSDEVDVPDESQSSFSDDDSDTPATPSKEYNETFNGEEQLQHALFGLSSKLKITEERLKIADLIPSYFKKQSRRKTIIGLNGIVSQWGVINPVHVMKMEDDDTYLILDGLRRIYAAMKNGMEEIDCRVWDFEDKVEGKKLVNVISLMINRTEHYRPIEQWNMLQLLESVNGLSPVLLEYLLQLEAGQAMKLKDVMLCEEDYYEIRDKLAEGEFDIETAYKKLCGERKKENRLQREDNTAIANTIADEEVIEQQSEKRRLSDDEVHDLLELANTDVTGKDISELDMTDEIRSSDKYQTTDDRHPVDPSIRQSTFIRDDFHCRCCGIGGPQWLGVLVFHHAVPVYAGGPDTVDNGLTLCQNCHMTLHNYIQGKVQVKLDELSEGQQTTFKNIFKYGNVALKAVQSRGISRDELAKIDKTGKQHAFPDANLKDNVHMYSQAQAQGAVKEPVEDVGDTDDTMTFDFGDNEVGDEGVNAES